MNGILCVCVFVGEEMWVSVREEKSVDNSASDFPERVCVVPRSMERAREWRRRGVIVTVGVSVEA